MALATGLLRGCVSWQGCSSLTRRVTISVTDKMSECTEKRLRLIRRKMTTQEPNPYKAPQVQETSIKQTGDYYVEMPYLVVRNGARLPLRCVITNAPESGLYREAKFRYPNRFFQFAITNRTCKVQWAVSEEIHRKHRHRATGRGLITFGAVLLMFGPTVAVTVPIAGLIWFLFLFVSFGFASFFWFKGVRGPELEKYRRGYFWIKGLGPEFLASLQEEQQSSP